MEYNLENPDFPLRRFVKHPNGVTLTGGWSTGRHQKYPYYRFTKLNIGFKRKDIENSFKVYMDEFRLEKEDYKFFIDAVQKNLVKENQDKIKEARELKTYVTELEEKKRDLLRKNIKGLISEEILHEHIGMIKEEICNAEKALAELPDIKANFSELLKEIGVFLKTPGTVWKNAPFHERLELQRFNFPKGVTFDGEEFRTGEVASIYKVKDLFLPAQSLTVRVGRGSWN